MKNVITLLFFLSITVWLCAQTQVNQSIPLGKAQQISLDFEFADVVFSSWDRSEVQITGSISINNGEHDDAFQIIADQKGNVLHIETTIKNWEDLPKLTTVKKDGQTYYFKGKLSDKEVKEKLGEGSFDWTSYGVAKDIQLQIKVPADVQLVIESKYGNLELQECHGPLSVENTYGHIEASFTQGLSAETQLHATYSFVDVSLPAKSNVNVELKSNYGTIYTDHNIVIDKQQSKEENFSRFVVGKLNDGGKKLSLKANYSNIYLRKG